MKNMNESCLTDQHLLLFGTIIQWFARYEFLMQEVMATVAGADCASIMLLTRDLGFAGKLRALLELLRHHVIPLDQFDRINEHLTIANTLAPLRNDIAHSAWVPGTSASWIQPDWILRLPRSIKPLRTGLGAATRTFFELERDKVAYSIDDLNEIIETLATNYDRLSEYLREIRLIGAGVRAPRMPG